ncbi:MAG: ribose 5-phosphate isomerase B [Proteobacteria bacterium]|nr:ribose 5-phosphate isomerase B [Pseudomonadota bacterium]
MKIVIAADHAGYALKTIVVDHLKSIGVDVIDLGTNDSSTSVDYPDYAKKVAREIMGHTDMLGILICGTGVGMSITANKFRGIRAASVSDTFSARMSRMHNDSNILCFGGRVVGGGLAIDIVDAWLNAEFEGGRHANRLKKIKEGEE